jgi:hypothetical protein
LAWAQDKNFVGGIFGNGDYETVHGSPPLIAPLFVAGNYHCIANPDGTLKYDTVEIGFGADLYGNPQEIIPVMQIFSWGLPTIGSVDDFFIAKLAWAPTTATPIALRNAPITTGMTGLVTGYGQWYDPVIGFVADDGLRRCGNYDVHSTWLGHPEYLRSKFYAPGPDYDVNALGGTPGLSSGPVAFLNEDSQAWELGAFASAVAGDGYNRATYALEVDAERARIDSVIPEPAALLLLVVGVLCCPRRRAA